MKKLFAGIIGLCLTVLSFAQDRIVIGHGPYLQNLKETEVTIVWIASRPSVGWVELALDDNTSFYQQERPKYFNVTNGVKNTSLIHTVKLTGLTPGTKYRYLSSKPDADIKFPVIVNAHKTVLKGVVKNNQLELVVKDLDGKIVDQININTK